MTCFIQSESSEIQLLTTKSIVQAKSILLFDHLSEIYTEIYTLTLLLQTDAVESSLQRDRHEIFLGMNFIKDICKRTDGRTHEGVRFATQRMILLPVERIFTGHKNRK